MNMSDGWRKFWTIILGVVFVLAFVAFIFGVVIRRDLLAPDLYTQALSENAVYDRVYTELLADPAVQEQFKELTGIEFNLLTEEAYAQIVGALYVILPPAQMESATNQFFTRLTNYLAGNTPELPENLELGQALTPEVLAGRVVRAATAVTIEAVDKTTPIVERGTEVLSEALLTSYLDEISNGRIGPIPRQLIRATTRGLSGVDSERLVTLMLGPAAASAGDDTRLQMEAALAADDMPGAIALAVTERLKLRVTERLAAAEPQLAETQALIGISGAAAQLGRTRDQVVGGLNTVRGYAELLQRLLIPLVLVMLAAMILIIWLNADDLRSALRAAGWTLVAASGLVMGLWLIGGLIIRSILRTNLAAAQIGTAALDGIIDDVVGSLSRGIWSSVWTTALFWLVIGLVLLAFAYSERLMDFLKRLLAPVWAYKCAVLAGVVGVFVLLPLVWRLATAEARQANLPCNGFVELCDRPLNEVAYASSHNAMSIAEYGWIWPMHDGTITDQLNDGVRALLIDTHYLDTAKRRSEVLASLPPEMRAVAQKAIARFRPPSLEGEFLCHQLCGLGYSSALDALEEVRVFLETNPREILFIIIQDEITASDTDSVVARAGLLPYIYDHPEGQPWPTLRELIDRNERLIIMAENEGPPPDWYTNVWESTEETPYTFIFKEDFSCKPNRGDTGKDFFLLNHWIQRGAPNRVDAAIVNDYDFLLARARQCESERGKMPNFIAVNWYSQGDLIDVVNTLNGVGQPQPAVSAQE